MELTEQYKCLKDDRYPVGEKNGYLLLFNFAMFALFVMIYDHCYDENKCLVQCFD